MSAPRAYTDNHPRWYREPVSTWWWLRRRAYVLFILREVSSVFVGWSVVFLLMLVHAVGKGPGSYAKFPLFHAAHRFRFTLYDGLQLKHLNGPVAVACYGGAIVGTVAAAYLLWQVR